MGLLIGSGVLLSAIGLDCARVHAAVTYGEDGPNASHKESAGALKKTGKKAAKKTVRKTAAIRKRAASAQVPAPVIVSKVPNNAPDFDFQDRIQEAQTLVAAQPVGKDDMRFGKDGRLSHFTWTLAVGRKTGPLTIVRMDDAGKTDSQFAITWAVDNFLNTQFRVARPDGYIVFAQRRPVRAKDGYREAVYTAYSPELDTRTMRQAGLEYLRHLQRQAYNRIKDRDVRSRVAPGFTVAEKIPPSMVLRLMIAEHIDPLHMKYVGIEQCIHEVLFTIAANRSNAYAYAKSSAGALGLPQFMEDSYRMVRANYPQALLEPDFERGIRDLHNAVLASVLLLDLELTHLPQDYLHRFSGSNQQLAAFLAAGYNRNPARVVQTYHRTHTLTGGDAPFENRMYVRIQSWVGRYLRLKYGVS